MNPFQILNARTQTIDEILRVDTGRQEQREIVRRAVLDYSHNVYIYGTRGSGKTFFQKTLCHYLAEQDADVLPLFIPIELRIDTDAEELSLHVLYSLCIEWWQRFYKRPKSDLLRLATTDDQTLLDGMHPQQQRFVQLYRLLHATQFRIDRRQSSAVGATAIAKAELRREQAQSYSRDSLLPSEISAVLDELAELTVAKSHHRVVVHLDEVEVLDPTQQERFLAVCLGMFNPIGVQFVITGAPVPGRNDNFVASSIETTVELEGFSSVEDLGSMINKYASGTDHAFDPESLAVLYEFFKGHPRTSLGACAFAVEVHGKAGGAVAPRAMVKGCLQMQKNIDAWKAMLPRTTGG